MQKLHNILEIQERSSFFQGKVTIWWYWYHGRLTPLRVSWCFMSGVLVYINPLVPAMSMALPAASSQVWRDLRWCHCRKLAGSSDFSRLILWEKSVCYPFVNKTTVRCWFSKVSHWLHMPFLWRHWLICTIVLLLKNSKSKTSSELFHDHCSASICRCSTSHARVAPPAAVHTCLKLVTLRTASLALPRPGWMLACFTCLHENLRKSEHVLVVQ